MVHFRASVTLLSLVIFTPAALAQTVILAADNNSGHDAVWIKRYAANKNSWGIVGNHIPGTSGNIWFNAFPGASGQYKMELGAVLEPDGDSSYKVEVGGKQVAAGKYPYSTGKLDCAASTLSVSYLALGTHAVQKGDKINLWGNAVYPCGTDHGQYTRWFEIKLTKVGGTIADAGPAPDAAIKLDAAVSAPDTATAKPDASLAPPQILSPKAGTNLVEGKPVTLQGQGAGTLSWSYDANSDGKGEVSIGTGASVSFTVPTGVSGPRTLTLYLSAAGGKINQQHALVTSGQNPDAGPLPDQALPVDAAPATTDAGSPGDGLAAPADGAAGDLPVTVSDGAAGTRGEDGCSCDLGPNQRFPPWTLLLLPWLLRRRANHEQLLD